VRAVVVVQPAYKTPVKLIFEKSCTAGTLGVDHPIYIRKWPACWARMLNEHLSKWPLSSSGQPEVGDE
jgi:hypothetical protein